MAQVLLILHSVKGTPMAPKNKTQSSTAVADKKPQNIQLLERIAKRAHYYSTQMIHLANNRDDVQKGDPKVGGHPAACASLTHVMAALHLAVRQPQDHMAVKPHGSPMDHAYNHLMGLFYSYEDGHRFSDVEAKKVMPNLRKFTNPEVPGFEHVFQSYHAAWDPDSHNYFPTHLCRAHCSFSSLRLACQISNLATQSQFFLYHRPYIIRCS